MIQVKIVHVLHITALEHFVTVANIIGSRGPVVQYQSSLFTTTYSELITKKENDSQLVKHGHQQWWHSLSYLHIIVQCQNANNTSTAHCSYGTLYYLRTQKTQKTTMLLRGFHSFLSMTKATMAMMVWLPVRISIRISGTKLRISRDCLM